MTFEDMLNASVYITHIKVSSHRESFTLCVILNNIDRLSFAREGSGERVGYCCSQLSALSKRTI
jgi:hypothetical protein